MLTNFGPFYDITNKSWLMLQVDDINDRFELIRFMEDGSHETLTKLEQALVFDTETQNIHILSLNNSELTRIQIQKGPWGNSYGPIQQLNSLSKTFESKANLTRDGKISIDTWCKGQTFNQQTIEEQTPSIQQRFVELIAAREQLLLAQLESDVVGQPEAPEPIINRFDLDSVCRRIPPLNFELTEEQRLQILENIRGFWPFKANLSDDHCVEIAAKIFGGRDISDQCTEALGLDADKVRDFRDIWMAPEQPVFQNVDPFLGKIYLNHIFAHILTELNHREHIPQNLRLQLEHDHHPIDIPHNASNQLLHNDLPDPDIELQLAIVESLANMQQINPAANVDTAHNSAPSNDSESELQPIPPSYWMMFWNWICQFIASLCCCRSEQGISP